MVTPLQPKLFFQGKWTGDGEIIPNPLLRWFTPSERFHMESEAVWLSDTFWVVNEWFEFASGRILERKMFAELIASDRIHITADDIPFGTDIILEENAFRFTPYIIVVNYRGLRFRLHCIDESTVDHNGLVHDLIKMRLLGFPVATMKIDAIVRTSAL